MKKIHLFIIACTLCLSYSCSGMLDSIQPYLDEGETVYVGKLDSLKAFSGKNRIKVEGKMMYGVNQIKCVINYRNPNTLAPESQEFPVVRQNAGETFEFILTDLAEGQYDFYVVTYDPKGNQSIPTEVSAYAYGEQYQETLKNRIIRSFDLGVFVDDQSKWKTKINWNISRGDGLIGCNLEYEQSNGTFKSIYVPVNETVTELIDYKSDGVLRYNTEYKADDTTLDIFTTDYVTTMLPPIFKSDVTSLYIKNAGFPFQGNILEGRWGTLYDWSCSQSDSELNAIGKGFYTDMNGGTIQFETYQWGAGPRLSNGKLYQTITLPKGKYQMRVFVQGGANDQQTVNFAIALGNSLPNNENMDQALSFASINHETDRGKEKILPMFELTETTTVTIGWVVTFHEICRNVVFNYVRLYSNQ